MSSSTRKDTEDDVGKTEKEPPGPSPWLELKLEYVSDTVFTPMFSKEPFL